MRICNSLIEYYIFITKLCCLTTLTPLISYTHNGDDTHKSFKRLSNFHIKLHAPISEIKPNAVRTVNYLAYTLLASKRGLT